jgi:hypothetical protein
MYYYCVTKSPAKNHIREEGCILAHGFSSWLFGPMLLSRASWWWEHVADEVLQLKADRKQRD